MDKYDRSMSVVVRKDILKMSYIAQVAHIPSALSQCDYLGVLFMNKGINPQSYRFVFGKPFGAQAYYSLFLRCGWTDMDLNTYGGTNPECHYIIQKEHPLVSYIDESMGNALGVACGIAQSGNKVFVNMSDASFQEGTVWESLLFAGANNLSNLIIAVDYNRMQALGAIDNICSLASLENKIRQFGWEVFSTNGHEIEAMQESIPDFRIEDFDVPVALIFHTKKGKGISFMEDNEKWHYKALSKEEYLSALNELTNEKMG